MKGSSLADTTYVQVNGTAVPSMTSKLMGSNTNSNGDVVDEDIIAKATGIAYAGWSIIYLMQYDLTSTNKHIAKVVGIRLGTMLSAFLFRVTNPSYIAM